jgi:hypothetical protein
MESRLKNESVKDSTGKGEEEYLKNGTVII